eukprot:3893802-Rhodomonas_salina.1
MSTHALSLSLQVGAECDGQKLWGQVAGSVWEAEGPHLRLRQCPRGYIVVHDPASPQSDACVACPFGTYSLVPARVGGSL